MIYFTSETGTKVLVLEESNLDELRKGRPAIAADKSVVVAYTPDMEWLAKALQESGSDFRAALRLIDESMSRPQAPPRPYSPPVRIDFKRKGGMRVQNWA